MARQKHANVARMGQHACQWAFWGAEPPAAPCFAGAGASRSAAARALSSLVEAPQAFFEGKQWETCFFSSKTVGKCQKRNEAFHFSSVLKGAASGASKPAKSACALPCAPRARALRARINGASRPNAPLRAARPHQLALRANSSAPRGG